MILDPVTAQALLAPPGASALARRATLKDLRPLQAVGGFHRKIGVPHTWGRCLMVPAEPPGGPSMPAGWRPR